MKKTLFVFILFLGFFASAQDFAVKVEVVKNIKISEATRDSYVVPASEIWHVELTDGTKWSNNGGAGWVEDVGGGASELSDLSDVSSATATNRFALMGNGTTFASRALVEADISNFGTYIETLSDLGITATATEINYIDGATSNIQTQLDGKLDLSGGTMSGVLDMNGQDIDSIADLEVAGNINHKWFLTGETPLEMRSTFVGGNSWYLRPYFDNSSTNNYIFYNYDLGIWSFLGKSFFREMAWDNINNSNTVSGVFMNSGADFSFSPSGSGKQLSYNFDADEWRYNGVELGAGGGSSPPFDANSAILQDETDNTKLLDWDLSGLTTSTTRTITMPDAPVDLGNLGPSNINLTSEYNWTNTHFFDNFLIVASGEYFGVADGVSGRRWSRSLDGSGHARFTYQNSPNTDQSGTYTTLYTLNNTGTPSSATDLVDKAYADALNTDDQTLSLGGTGNKDLTIEDGNTIDLTGVDGIDPDNIVSTGTGRTSPVQYTDIYGQTQANYTTDGAPSAGELVIITDASPAEVVTSATVTMEGWKMYDDQTTDAATITLSDCDPGETLTVYINRASAPTLAGTGLTFNQLPNTTAFAAATEMMIIFEVAYDGTTIDYYYVER